MNDQDSKDKGFPMMTSIGENTLATSNKRMKSDHAEQTNVSILSRC